MSGTESSSEVTRETLLIQDAAEYIGPVLAEATVKIDPTLIETDCGKRKATYTTGHISGLGNPFTGDYYDM